MIRPSSEIEAVTRRFMEALAVGDVETRTGLFSENPVLFYLGTAEGELWNADMLRQGYAAYADAMPNVEIRDIKVTAHESGTAGWSVWTGTLRFLNSDRVVPFRTTLVFVLEKGNWKIIQVHNSTPTENVENLGFDYSVLDDLVEAARSVAETGWSGVTTIMFTDIADSSALAAAVGDAAWTNRIRSHFETVQDLIATHGGQMVKSLGDGTMSSFSSARSALEAAGALQRSMASDTTEPRLRLRIGLHTGEVQQTTDDFFGTVVNKAARIASIAGPGEIRVSDATRLMVGGDGGINIVDPLSTVLRGFEGNHLIHRLEWQP